MGYVVGYNGINTIKQGGDVLMKCKVLVSGNSSLYLNTGIFLLHASSPLLCPSIGDLGRVA